MINSILLPQIVYDKLSNDATIVSLVGNKVFPLIADYGTQFPYIAFSAGEIVPYYDKDGAYENDAVIEFVVASKDYFNALTIANAVRSLFEKKLYSNANLSINDCIVKSVSEAYDDAAQCFVKRISFSFSVE